MKNKKNLEFGTETIHSKSNIDFGIKSLSTPIFQTSTFYFNSVEEAGQVFSGELEGFGYSRGKNPTVAELEAKLAVLEAGEACVVTSSGMGAIGSTLLGLLSKGDHIVAGDCLYGCTSIAIKNVLSKFGIEYTFTDTSHIENVSSSIRPNTKVIYLETPTNPTIKVTDIEAIAKIAKSKGIYLVVDNTFSPPPIQKPLELGADFVVHSLTKYINGHGDVIGGAIIGPEEEISYIKSSIANKLCGTILSPSDAFLIMRGMKTLELRIARHCSNAIEVAKFLEGHDLVAEVFYPGLDSHPQHNLSKKQMNNLYGGMISFKLKEGINGLSSYAACKKLLNNLELITIAVSLGDAETLIQHPASMTHNSLTDEEKEASKIEDDLIRLSVGLENYKDILNDLDRALTEIE